MRAWQGWCTKIRNCHTLPAQTKRTYVRAETYDTQSQVTRGSEAPPRPRGVIGFVACVPKALDVVFTLRARDVLHVHTVASQNEDPCSSEYVAFLATVCNLGDVADHAIPRESQAVVIVLVIALVLLVLGQLVSIPVPALHLPFFCPDFEFWAILVFDIESLMQER